jgi:hypothetical protein
MTFANKSAANAAKLIFMGRYSPVPVVNNVAVISPRFSLNRVAFRPVPMARHEPRAALTPPAPATRSKPPPAPFSRTPYTAAAP